MDYSIEIVFYNLFLTYFVPYIIANATRFGINSTQTAQLTTYLGQWNTKYGLYVDPATHSSITTGDINTLWDTVFAYTEAIKQEIKATPNLPLSALDYAVTQIHKDSNPRGSVPVPKQDAAVSLRNTTHLSNTFGTYDMANPSKLGKPPDTSRVGIKLLVLPATDPAPTIGALISMPDSGKMKFTMSFLEAQVGMKGYIAVCFKNDKGEEGPWSVVFPFSII